MPGLNTSLSIAVQALAAEQGALNVTTNNIANVNTPGYSRQRPVLNEAPTFQESGTTFGGGVTLEQFQSVRDQLLQLVQTPCFDRFWPRTARGGFGAATPRFDQRQGTTHRRDVDTHARQTHHSFDQQFACPGRAPPTVIERRLAHDGMQATQIFFIQFVCAVIGTAIIQPGFTVLPEPLAQALGGPLKKNRAWIFGAYQRTGIRQDTVLISTVPLPAAKNGAFSTPIFDPNTTVQSGAAFMRTAFPNNTIPASLFNSVGKSVTLRYPDPNLPGAANNFIRTAPVTTNLHNATFRGDVQISSKDSMFARFGLNTGGNHGESPLPPPAATPVDQQLPAWNVGYGYTRVFGPSLVNEFRFSWSRPSVTKDGTVPRDCTPCV